MKDPRIINEMIYIRRTDDSFKNESVISFINLLSGGKKYTQSEVREIWFQAIEIGLERGLNMGLPSGKVVDIKNMTPKQEKFYQKFLKLCEDYNCCIEYSTYSDTGMIISDLNPNIRDVVEYNENDILKNNQ